MKNEKDRIRETTMCVVGLLASGGYDELGQMSNNTRLTAEDMELAVRDYGGQLVFPPEEAFDEIDSIRISVGSVPSWSVRFALWTIEEGRSDLSVEMTLYEQDEKLLKVEMDNIIVF